MSGRSAAAALESTIAWGIAGRALPGQAVSGDLHVVARGLHRQLAAVIDGLGHGTEAAAAAAVAAAILAAHPDQPVTEILTLCHARMRRTPGAAISAVCFDRGEGTLTWAGVGNVEGLLQRAVATAEPRRDTLLLRGGIIGSLLPPLRATTLNISPGDTVVLATDGIGSGFRRESVCDRPVQTVAEAMLDRYAKPNDDALVLVARYGDLS